VLVFPHLRACRGKANCIAPLAASRPPTVVSDPSPLPPPSTTMDEEALPPPPPGGGAVGVVATGRPLEVGPTVGAPAAASTAARPDDRARAAAASAARRRARRDFALPPLAQQRYKVNHIIGQVCRAVGAERKTRREVKEEETSAGRELACAR